MLFFVGNSVSRADTALPFAGQIDFLQKQFLLSFSPQDQKPIVVSLKRTDQNQYQLSFQVDHFKIALFDVSMVIDCQMEVKEHPAQGLWMVGTVRSDYTLIDQKPTDGISGQFEVKDGVLNLTQLNFGEVVMNGFLQLKGNHQLKLTFHLAAMPLAEFLALFVDRETVSAEGVVDGDLVLEGSLSQMTLKGKVASSYGRVGNLEYDEIDVSAAGIFPLIELTNAHVIQSDGLIFKILGKLNLLERATLLNQIKELVLVPMVETEEDKLEWTLKRKQLGAKVGTTELKYLHRKTDDAKHLSDERSDMIGVEQKVKF